MQHAFTLMAFGACFILALDRLFDGRVGFAIGYAFFAVANGIIILNWQ